MVHKKLLQHIIFLLLLLHETTYLQGKINLLLRHVGTSKMHHGLDTVYGLSVGDNFGCKVGRRTASTPSYINEFGTKSFHALRGPSG